MAKKLKSLNPIIGTGYKTLSMIKDGEDGNIENFPDTLPKIPRLSYKRLGVSGLEIGWEFEDKIYYTYELYGSTTKGFEASEENLIFQGLASSYFYEAKPGEKWYFKARAKNTHGRYTEFSSELVTYTVKLDNLGEYVEGGAINGALIENATINNAHIKDLHADKITAGVLDADRIGANSITANKIEANAITSEKIQANAITSGHIQTGAITAGSGIIADGAIGNAQISKIDAGKIEAGTIDTSRVTIQGANGHLRLKGNRMQVFNGVGNQAKERVSVGDVNGDGTVYGLRVRGADGQTVLLDENGVTSEGITDGSITNDKINEDANIDGAKLNINSVINKINTDGTEVIQGTKVEVDGTNLGVKLSEITNKQIEDSEKITQAYSQIEANEKAIKLKVDEQTYTADKRDMTSKLEKNTSEITTMKGQIALKVEQTDIENAKSEMEGVIDTKIDSAKAEIKVTTDAISQNVSNVETKTTTITDLAKAMAGGKILNTDAMFKKEGNNGIGVYNNSNNGVVTINRIAKVSGCPTSSTHCLEVKTTGTASPYFGGFYFGTPTRANQVLITRIIAKIPTGRNISWHSNATGNGSSQKWLTSTAGTGKWEEYICQVKCGTDGSFSSTNFFAIKDGSTPTTSNPLVWHIAYATVIDITDSDESVNDLTTRMSTAESKLTKDSLTTTIGSHYTTSSDVNGIVTSKGYATTSEVQQTKNELTATFKESGGYNLIRNGGFKNGTVSWSTHGTPNTSLGTSSNVACGKYVDITFPGGLYGNDIELQNNKYYTYSARVYPNSEISMHGTYPLYPATNGSSYDSSNCEIVEVSHSKIPAGTWTNIYIVFKIKAANVKFQPWLYHGSASGVRTSFADVQLEEGKIRTPWSPHSQEIYDGITKIDKNGIQVSQSNYNGYTQMKADGFYVNNGSENVISVTSSGATFKGKVTIQSGSSVPTSTLSGTISSNQLNSSITSDINNANNNASSALSTANSASTNATNALNTANSVNSTVDSNKGNWSNAYNRVKEWASGAVTGTTNINGGMIATNTITADKIASRTIIADRIAAGAITANEIKSGTITSDRIASRTITADRIAAGAITANEIASGTITANEIASNSITSAKIASGAITSAKIASGAITANMITTGTMSADRITGGTLKSTNGDMYFDMDNGHMVLSNNGTRVGQTMKNKISGSDIYGLASCCEYNNYSCLGATTSSSASTYTMMVSVAGKDLTGSIRKGVNIGATTNSNGHNFHLHNSYLCFGLGASSYSSVGQIRWYSSTSSSSDYGWIGNVNTSNMGIYGRTGAYIGYRDSSGNNGIFSVTATSDSYNAKAHIWSHLNMHDYKIRGCQGVATASVELSEPIPFAYSKTRDGEYEQIENTYNVVKTKQNIVESIGSVTITEDMVDTEIYIKLDGYVAYKNYMVILSPIGEDRKVCILRKEDDGFYIKGNQGEVDYTVKFECIDVAKYRSATGENVPQFPDEEKEEPKEVVLET